MNRRQHLAQLGGVGLVALSGCLDTISSDETDVTVTDRTGHRALDRAIGRLNETAIELSAHTDSGAASDTTDGSTTTTDNTSADTEFDPTPHSERLESARSLLDTAASELESDRQADVDLVRDYADVLEGLVSVTATVTDDELEREIEEVSAAFDVNPDDEGTTGDAATDDLDDARDTLSGRSGHISEAQDLLETATQTVDGFDDARYESLPTVDRAQLVDGFEALESVLGSQAVLVAGYDELLVGYDDLEAGREYFADDEYGAAETAFLDAKSSFEAGTETIEDGSESAPAELATAFETAHCQGVNLQTAAAEFAASAAAADDRDITGAHQHQDAAEDALAAAGECSE
ncbi:uncharacterized protein Nmag_1801 [Natrialba magadii ATCC 43099]|uniref:Uncharacterized protein n=1 Tax=Natrialba magadii (strain ATCC 43099 / DSM 3394 / CCM 3739 / CIP 104546 / IAM 13178 / JCM 8861 / NBRC 102185 / NCIMB 2190 / MS3) TaxID=547559 RepID=D3SUW7_NATMM|nr:hypothetical protein [Natrialba magadii]ADD05375.1 uncharacterized protein Nmag_1801 [Natrialba magadii ATCC 43099]ELY29309.1 hypothetical protein C500_11345 [Natrialba magadii ATCC 43099]